MFTNSKLVLFLIIGTVISLLHQLHSHENSEEEIFMLHESLGEEIDEREREQIHLFPLFQGFKSAVFYQLPGGGYHCHVRYTDENTHTEKLNILTISESRMSQIQNRIDQPEKNKSTLIRLKVSAFDSVSKPVIGILDSVHSDTLMLHSEQTAQRFSIPFDQIGIISITHQKKQHFLLTSMLLGGLAGVVTGIMFYEAQTSNDSHHLLIGRSDYIRLFFVPLFLLGGIEGYIKETNQWKWEEIPLNELNLNRRIKTTKKPVSD
jgi:hypothetical protein